MGLIILIAGPLYILIAGTASQIMAPVSHGSPPPVISQVQVVAPVTRDYSACLTAGGQFVQECVDTVDASARP